MPVRGSSGLLGRGPAAGFIPYPLFAVILRDNSRRAEQATGSFQVLAGVLLLTIVSDFWYMGQLTAGQSADEIDTGSLLGIAHNLLMIIELVSLITGLVLLVRWLRRAYWNLHALQQHLDYSEGWAAGAWFVPFLNLYRPYSIVKEVWRQTQLLAYERVEPHGLLRAWWVLFTLHSLVSNMSGRLLASAATTEQLQSATTADVVSASLGIATALLTVRVVRRIAEFEEQLALLQQVKQLGGPAPRPAAELEQDQPDFD